jgi:hypothetical protein
VYRALGWASLARRFCVRRLRWASGLAAEGAAAGLRMRHLPSAGIGDGGNRVSSDADGFGEVVSCRLPDGSRQARRLGQISAARTGGDVSDGLDRGAQAAPRIAVDHRRVLQMLVEAGVAAAIAGKPVGQEMGPGHDVRLEEGAEFGARRGSLGCPKCRIGAMAPTMSGRGDSAASAAPEARRSKPRCRSSKAHARRQSRARHRWRPSSAWVRGNHPFCSLRARGAVPRAARLLVRTIPNTSLKIAGLSNSVLRGWRGFLAC